MQDNQPLCLSPLCVAVQADTPAQLFERASVALSDTNFLELRLDSVRRPVDALPLLKQFAAAHPEAAILATCRRVPHGGGFRGDLADELGTLHRAAENGARILDLEIESAEEAGPEVVETFRGWLRKSNARLLISFHDFSNSDRIDEAVARINVFQPDIVKVVVTAKRLTDNMAVLHMLEQRLPNVQIVGVAMGEEGLPTRILGPGRGGLFTFAASEDGEETAPGQVTAEAMRSLYRIDEITAQTKIYGVAGNPVHHSLSPLMHNEGFRREGMDAVMLPLLARQADDLLAFARELPICGLAVTMPLKLEVLPYLKQADKLVERIGACNTLRLEADGGFTGFNTDAAGVLRPLAKRMEIPGSRIAVLGAGGAARAAIFALADAGAEVYIVNRTQATAEAVAREAGAQVLPRSELKTQCFDVLINSTSCGMAGSIQALPIEADELHANLVFDLVYNPLETPLLKLAAAQGMATIGGIEMFVQQGVRQFEIWTGKAAPEQAMREIVTTELRRRQ